MNLYSNLRKNPFVRLLVPYIIGLIFAKAFSEQIPGSPYITLVGFIFLLGLYLFAHFFKLNLKLTDFFIPALVFSASILHYSLNSYVSVQESGNSIIIARVLEPPIEKPNSFQVKLKQLNSGFHHPGMPGIILYTSKDSTALDSLKPGHIIYFDGSLGPIKNKGNPDEFDYALYQASKGFFYQSYVPLDQIYSVSHNDFFSQFVQFINNIRSTARESAHSYFGSKDISGIIPALVIGDKSELDEDLIADFSDAGVVHVLAISGLHIGILYMFLGFILSPLQYSSRLRIVRTIIIVVCIWFYASITGFSSSVSRAATMFTLMAIGKTLKREVSIYNIIAASAFFLLLANPLLLFDVGFQLSYAAVVGIVFFYPVFYSWFSVRNRILDYVIKLLCVSFAAQLSTAPITIYFFNQFPVYFWLANLFVIPLVFAILFLGIFFLIAANVAVVAKALSFVIGILSDLMYRWVKFIIGLPYSTIEGLHINLFQVFLLMAIIYSFFIWFSNKKFAPLLAFLILAFTFMIVPVYQLSFGMNNQKLVFYSTYGGTNIGLYLQNESVLFTDFDEDSLIRQKNKYFNRHWLMNYCYNRIQVKELCGSFGQSNNCGGSFITIHDSLGILKLNKGFQDVYKDEILKSHYIVVGDNVLPPKGKIKIDGTLIISAGMKKYIVRLWHKFAKENQISFYDIGEQGALIVEL